MKLVLDYCGYKLTLEGIGVYDDIILEIIVWLCVFLSVILFIFSTAAFGSQYSDLQYQKEAGINGPRQIQSKINIRINSNRMLVAFVFAGASIIMIADVNIYLRGWIVRLGFLSILIAFTISSVLDWVAHKKQIKYLMNDPYSVKLASLRTQMHGLRQPLAVVFSGISLLEKTDKESEILDEAMKEVTEKLDQLQNDIRSLDPQFRV